MQDRSRKRAADKSVLPASIQVAGDAYTALFYLPPGRLFLKGVQGAHALTMPVGAGYIYQAIRAICDPEALLCRPNKRPLSGPMLTQAPGRPPFSKIEGRLAWYEMSNVGHISAHENLSYKLPLLRPSRQETNEVTISGFGPDNRPPKRRSTPKAPDVLVHWLGELACNQTRQATNTPNACKVHIQVGLREPLQPIYDSTKPFRPAWLAKPSLARVVVVNIGEISATHRVRRSFSYEAIAVDLLRFLRGDGAKAKQNEIALNQLSMGEAAPPWTALAVRINNSAVFLYVSAKGAKSESVRAEKAWLLCHKQESAPLTEPELGHMVGYTGFVSAQLAASLANHLEQNPEKTAWADETPIDPVLRAIRRSLIWQRIAYERGCFHMLFRRKEDIEGNLIGWQAIEANQRESDEEYNRMFADIVQTLRKRQEGAALHAPGANANFNDRLTQFDRLFNEVFAIPVQIDRAVAHRTQWFMARSVAETPPEADLTQPAQPTEIGVNKQSYPDCKLKEFFLRTALSWLSRSVTSDRIVKPTNSPIPIVTIGKAELTDRREVEDFLAIHQALNVYAHSSEQRPLSIAVFGGPGSGKSFAVNQVVKHISATNQMVFKSDPLTFNLSQFKTLDDLPAALHLVRNDCLTGKIPIVFFDEFDCTFNSQPFGWLKFFLAPMQDGEFYHQGQNYKIGRAVFAFAGGVNRSFEELNGRIRNPGFCEAKGPDFISRLKAHLNVQGINQPEDEADQFRYILRRGILLRSIMWSKMALKEDQQCDEFLHRCVADALLRVRRFKHGVRSLEAIIKMCTSRPGYPIGPSDLPSMDQLEMHVDAPELLKLVDTRLVDVTSPK